MEIIFHIKELSRSELSPADRELLEHAEAMTNNAYAPYSHFHVGAAIRLDNGVIVTGANQENAAFPSGTCAERSACFNAGANFPDNSFEAIAIAAADANMHLTTSPVAPCGGCRQALMEYEKRAGHDVKVILGGERKVLVVPSVKSLLPLAFCDF